MIDPVIEKRFKELPSYYKEFVSGDFATDAAYILGDVANLNEEQATVFENLIILYLLFFIEKEEIPPLLFGAGVDSKEAQALTNALIASLPDFAKQEEETSAVPTETPVSVAPTTEPSALAEEIAETEKEIAELQSIRTMAGDMEAVRTHHEPVYQSSQADILHRAPAETPTAAPQSTGPRWGSEE